MPFNHRQDDGHVIGQFEERRVSGQYLHEGWILEQIDGGEFNKPRNKHKQKHTHLIQNGSFRLVAIPALDIVRFPREYFELNA
jgi:hypothetical protein